MLEKLKSKFKKKEKPELDPVERQKKSGIELIVYLLFFIIVIVVARLGNNNSNKIKKDTVNSSVTVVQSSEESIEEIDVTVMNTMLNNLTKYNYDMGITIEKGLEKQEFIRKMESADKEIVAKSTSNATLDMYLRKKDKYYKINSTDNTLLESENPKIFEGIDTTFLEIPNIISLLLNESNIIVKGVETFNYTVNLKTALDIYNKINHTSFKTNNTSIVVDVHYTDNINKIIINLSNFYRLTKDSPTDVIVTIEFKNINNINLTELENKLTQ